ncbi:MAG: hypothetical protein ACLTYN_17050 [Dysosmobacter welbionis]
MCSHGGRHGRGICSGGISAHDRTLYDYPEYAGAYDRSLAGIDRYLKEYPSIRFVLMSTGTPSRRPTAVRWKVVSEIEGQGNGGAALPSSWAATAVD